VGKDAEGDCGADVGALCGFAHEPRQRREQRAAEYGMGIRKKIQVDRTVAYPEMLDLQVGERDPEKLNGLNGNQQGPKTNARIFLLQRERRGGVGDGVRVISSTDAACAVSSPNRLLGVGNSEAAEVFLLSFSSLGRSR
jgi:hypothetical protein